MKYVRSTSDEAPLPQTASVEYHSYPHCVQRMVPMSLMGLATSKQGTRDKEVAERFEGAMINSSNPLCNNYKGRWKLGYCVSGNSFGRVRLQAFYAFPSWFTWFYAAPRCPQQRFSFGFPQRVFARNTPAKGSDTIAGSAILWGWILSLHMRTGCVINICNRIMHSVC